MIRPSHTPSARCHDLVNRRLHLAVALAQLWGADGESEGGVDGVARIAPFHPRFAPWWVEDRPGVEGRVFILGMDPDQSGPRIRGKLGVVPQEDTLDTELTVFENLLIYGR